MMLVKTFSVLLPILLLALPSVWALVYEAQTTDSEIQEKSVKNHVEEGNVVVHEIAGHVRGKNGNLVQGLVPKTSADHSFLRKTQTDQCYMSCNSHNYCRDRSGSCIYCVNNQCLSTQNPVCGTKCNSSSNFCYGATGSCTLCIANQCSYNPGQGSNTQCGLYCTGNSDCPTNSGCSLCANHQCEQNGGYQYNTQCGSCNRDSDCPSNCGSCVNHQCVQNRGYYNTQCGSCNRDSDCPSNCGVCVNHQCVQNSGYQYNTQCGSCNRDSDCPSNCGSCVNHQCVQNRGYDNMQCGSCTSNSNCPSNCGVCINNQCVQSTSSGSSTQCKSGCESDWACSGVCHRCLNGVCVQPYCRLYCSVDIDCKQAGDGCNYCNRNECSSASGNSGNRDFTGSTGACVSDYNGLIAAAANNNNIAICANSEISLNANVKVSTSGEFSLLCASGNTCTINGNHNYALDISATTVRMNGITFKDCVSLTNVRATSWI